MIFALSAAVPTTSPALLGKWAGPAIAMKATAEGAVISFDCASLRIGEPLTLSKSGRFEAVGRSSHCQPGPQLADQAMPDAPAHIGGRLRGNVLTLTLDEPGRGPASYILHRGGSHKLVRCL